MSIIYSMSDTHGFLKEFEEALDLVLIHLKEENSKLVLLGDYVHGGTRGSKVLDKIMSLQQKSKKAQLFSQITVLKLMRHRNHRRTVLGLLLMVAPL